MRNDLQNLWITRLPAGAPEPVVAVSPFGLAHELQNGRDNVAVVSERLDDARYGLLESLREVALVGLHGQADVATGWLVVDIPLSSRIDSRAVVHRMIRRLYFTAVLHGLAAVPAWREAVRSLRSSFLQTRGTVTNTRADEQVTRSGGELSFKLGLDLLSSLTGKLTAAEEVKVAETVAAQMERLDLFEAEDQLLYDLEILAQLHAYIDVYAQHTDPLLPRWEQIQNFFRAVVGRLAQKKVFELRPAFVFEVSSVSALVAVMGLFSDAASIAAGHGARVVLVGNQLLAAAWRADDELGGPIFRQRCAAYEIAYKEPGARVDTRLSEQRFGLGGYDQKAIERLLEERRPLPDDVFAVLSQMTR